VSVASQCELRYRIDINAIRLRERHIAPEKPRDGVAC
jgi:hypothetical protein